MRRAENGQSRLPLIAMIAGGLLAVGALAYVLFFRDTGPKVDSAATLAARCAFPACRAAFDPGLGRGYEGPSVAVDPADENHMVVTNANMSAGVCMWHVTFDRGKEWEDGVFKVEGYTGCHINAGAGGHVPTGPGGVSFGPSGTVYATYGSANPNFGERAREAVVIATSTDGAKSFNAKVAVEPPGDDISFARPLMSVVAGPNGKDRILLSFWQCRQGGRFCDSVYFARSDDGGATFTPPIIVNEPGQFGQYPSEPLQGPDGTIYMTFLRKYADGPSDLMLAKSSDGGSTFTYKQVDYQPQIGDRYDPAKLAMDPTGANLYLVYTDARTGGQQVIFRKSADKGVTWADPVGIAPSQEATMTGSSRTPSIAVAPDGRIDIVYYRTPQADTDNVFWGYSIDGGARFTSRQVNERPIRRYEFGAAIGTWYPPDIASIDSAAVIVWSDSMAAPDQDQNTQDVLLRRMLPPGGELPP
ncbi:MAG: sialidase family protein [Acidimicrobiales bacterium]